MPYENTFNDEERKKLMDELSGSFSKILEPGWIEDFWSRVDGSRSENAPSADILYKYIEEQKGKDFVREKILCVKQDQEMCSNLRYCCASATPEYALDMATVILETIERVGGKEFLLEHLRTVDNSSPYPALILALTKSDFKNSVEPIKLILDYCFKAGGNEFVKELMETVGREDSSSGEEVGAPVISSVLFNKLSPQVSMLLLDAIRRVDDDSGKKDLIRRNCKGTLAKLLEKKKEGEADKHIKQLCFFLADSGIFRSEYRAACGKYDRVRPNRLWLAGVSSNNFLDSVGYYEHCQQQGIDARDAKQEEEEEQEEQKILSEDEKTKLLKKYEEAFSPSSGKSISATDILDYLFYVFDKDCTPASLDFVLAKIEEEQVRAANNNNSTNKDLVMFACVCVHSERKTKTLLTHTMFESNKRLMPSILRRLLTFLERIGGEDLVLAALVTPGREMMTPLWIALIEYDDRPEILQIILDALADACNNNNEKIRAVFEELMQGVRGEFLNFKFYCSRLNDTSSLEMFQSLVDFMRRFGGENLLKRQFEGTLQTISESESATPDMKRLFCCALVDIDWGFFRSELWNFCNLKKHQRDILLNHQIDHAFMFSPYYSEHKTRRRLQAKATGQMTSSKKNNNNSNSSSTEGTATIKRAGLKKFFDFFDLERNGLLDTGAMVAAVTQAFPLCSSAEVEKIVRGTEPKSENGSKLDFDQFCLIVEKLI